MSRAQSPGGCVAVDKPAGLTSHDVVEQARRLLGEQRIGHAGTLDPDATGVLVLGVGRATRLLRFATSLPKSYAGEVVLGIATSTLDASGAVTGRFDLSGVTLEDARGAAATLTGRISQIPPMVSAIKVGGRRLYELSRAGVEVEREPRPVTVYRFEILALFPAGEPLRQGEPHQQGRPAEQGRPAQEGAASIPVGPVLSIEVDCSSGTYVRSLAADLGAALGGGAHLRSLRRTAVGCFSGDDLVPLEDLRLEALRPAVDLVAHLEQVQAGKMLALAVRQGKVLAREVLAGTGAGPWAVVDEAGALLAVYETGREALVKPSVVLQPAVGPESTR